MTEKNFVLKQDVKGAVYYGLIYGITVIVAGYLSYRFTENTALFYLFLFSFWYSIFAGVTTALSQCLLLLPFSLREIGIGPQEVVLRKKNGKEKILTGQIQYSASGKSMVINGVTDEGRKVAEVIRIHSFEEKDYDRLIQALKKFKK